MHAVLVDMFGGKSGGISYSVCFIPTGRGFFLVLLLLSC